MRLTVARHGETAYNAQGRYMGSTDIPLSDAGRAQAERLAMALEGRRFDVIASSPLLRAQETARIVQARVPAPIALVDAFRERNVGVFEGLTRQEARARYPDLWARECTRHPDDAPTGGETIRAFEARIVAGLARLHAAYGAGDVLLVCHGYVSRLVNKLCVGLDYEAMNAFLLDNCATISYDDEAVLRACALKSHAPPHRQM